MKISSFALEGETFSLAAASSQWPTIAVLALGGGLIGVVSVLVLHYVRFNKLATFMLAAFFAFTLSFWSLQGEQWVEKIPLGAFAERASFQQALIDARSYGPEEMAAMARTLDEGEFGRVSVEYFIVRENNHYEFVHGRNFDEKLADKKLGY